MKKSLMILMILLISSLTFTACSEEGTKKELSRLPKDYSLENAKNDGCVVFEDSDITSGQTIWDDFAGSAGKEEAAAVRLAYYYTLGDPSRYDPEYYEEIKDDYPKLYIKDLSYDGGKYVIQCIEDGKVIAEDYKNLVKYEGKPGSPHAIFSDYTYYVLVNDPYVSWVDIERGMLSSDSGDFIEHCLVYSDLVFR